MPANNTELEKRLWEAADDLRANSNLTSSQYSTPVLGLIFLKWADFRLSIAEKAFKKREPKSTRRRKLGRADYHAKGVLYLPKISRYSYLMNLPEKSDIGKAINDAMKAIEEENEDLRGVLPMDYHKLESEVLFSLLRNFNSIRMDIKGDVFGMVYEYFLGKFAMAEGRGGGQFYTPTSIVRLIVEIIEPFHGRIYDPACGSGGMFIQSGRFVQEHQKNPSEEISIYGQESKTTTVRLCKMNLAVHGLAGDIREGNSYNEDIHQSIGKFDFVMANPPFNVDKVDKDRIKDDKRFSHGIPRVDNANYLWIQIFYSALSKKGRAGFVMANSAGDARSSELEIRKKLIKEGVVDVIISIAPNFFYTVTLPCTLWFLDKGKSTENRGNSILFIDARKIYNQIDRAHRNFLPSQIEFITNVVRLYHEEKVELTHLSVNKTGDSFNSLEQWNALFPDATYRDVEGLCSVATIKEIEENGWSLNPGRYIDTAIQKSEITDIRKSLSDVLLSFQNLVDEAKQLENQIVKNISRIIAGKK